MSPFLAMGRLQLEMESGGLWWGEKNPHPLGKDLAAGRRPLQQVSKAMKGGPSVPSEKPSHAFPHRLH